MGQPKNRPEDRKKSFADEIAGGALRRQAVAIDPPPEGAIGIQELLSRFENFAETDGLGNSPQDGPVGVRELLARLANLTESGYFSPRDTDEPKKK